MAEQKTAAPEVEIFAEQLARWAHTLNQRQEAMLIDLLAKAGGDMYGHDSANASGGNEVSATSSETSPLELRDFGRAVIGIFSAEKPAGS